MRDHRFFQLRRASVEWAWALAKLPQFTQFKPQIKAGLS
jgi:hypothetical protein